jgi:hypothetical protein
VGRNNVNIPVIFSPSFCTFFLSFNSCLGVVVSLLVADFNCDELCVVPLRVLRFPCCLELFVKFIFVRLLSKAFLYLWLM